MTTDPATAPDDASDLWNRPPAKPRKCLGCGLRSEIYFNGSCWLCCQTGVADRVLTVLRPHEWRRLAGESS